MWESLLIATVRACSLCDHFHAPAAPPVVTFGAPHQGQRIANATFEQHNAPITKAHCAKYCAANFQCIAFSWSSAGCELSEWSPTYAVENSSLPSAMYQSKVRVGNRTAATRAVKYSLRAPTAGVKLLRAGNGSVLRAAFDSNLRYLSQYPVDDMLFWFRTRAGISNPHDAKNWGWDNGGPDSPMGLKGSVAGGFLMGAGGALRWEEGANNGSLARKVATLIVGIKACQNKTNGYLMAFPMNVSSYKESPDYVTSWLTHGLLEAAVAGFADEVLPMLRAHFNWFNSAENLPTFLPPAAEGQWVGSATRGPFVCDAAKGDVGCWTGKESNQFTFGHEIYLIYQGMIHNTRLALSAVGEQQDVDVVTQQYQETWWLEQLHARNLSAIWLRDKYPHNYEITAIEAYMDLYQLTGDAIYINAVDGFWDIFRAHWIHVGGTVAIKEWRLYPPGSYFLDTTGDSGAGHGVEKNCSWNPAIPDRVCPGPPLSDPKCKGCSHSTGETCGQVFWIKLNQRLHQYRPLNESYVGEIERTLLNGVISQLPPATLPNATQYPNGIRQFALLHKKKMLLDNRSTCCEGQATRMLGSLPEYLVNTGQRTLSIDMYQHALISLSDVFDDDEEEVLIANGSTLLMETKWPRGSSVQLRLQGSSPAAALGSFAIRVRIPSWLMTPTANVTLHTNDSATTSAASWEVPRGTYLSIPSRVWRDGDTLSFALSMQLQGTQYTGLTVVLGHDRYAVQYGPVLLALVSAPWNNALDTMVIPKSAIGGKPLIPTSWLMPAGDGNSLHFKLKRPERAAGGAGAVATAAKMRWIPYYEVQEELFEVYPSVPISLATSSAAVAPSHDYPKS